jgi:hypothetical protein
MLDGHRALEDADALGILVEDGLDIFCSPKRILKDGGGRN